MNFKNITMRSIYHSAQLPLTVFGLTLVLALSACSKKAAVAATPPPPADAAAATPTPAAPVNVPASSDVNQSMAAFDKAMQQRAYDQAVANLLAVQNQKNLSDQQAREARNRMAALQKNLANGVAAGDPNAIAAANQLRAAARSQHQ